MNGMLERREEGEEGEEVEKSSKECIQTPSPQNLSNVQQGHYLKKISDIHQSVPSRSHGASLKSDINTTPYHNRRRAPPKSFVYPL